MFTRDRLGLINLKMDTVKKFGKTGKRGIYSFEYDNKKYYLKEFKNMLYIYNEMIGYELGKYFELDMVPSDLVNIDDYIGYLSVDYMKKGYYYLEDLLIYFYNTFVDKNNLKDVSFMFLCLFGEEVSKRITDELIKLMMFDIIIANSDRHDRNIIINMNDYKLGPVADNEMMLSDMAIYDNYYAFSVNNDGKCRLDEFLSMLDGDQLNYSKLKLELLNSTNGLDEFLNILDDEQLQYFKEKLELINNKNIIDIIDKVQSKLEAPMIGNIKNNIISKFEDNYKTLSKLVDIKINERGMEKSLWK